VTLLEDDIDNETSWSNAYFRGTPNSWGTSAMTSVGEGLWEIEVTFSEGNNGDQPRFKITPENNWNTYFPNEDWVVQTGPGTYRIEFDEPRKWVTVTKLN